MLFGKLEKINFTRVYCYYLVNRSQAAAPSL
ncbi:MAG: hypothetical protein ACI80S_001175, partial [Pseudohongiellaceae bacterium]